MIFQKTYKSTDAFLLRKCCLRVDVMDAMLNFYRVRFGKTLKIYRIKIYQITQCSTLLFISQDNSSGIINEKLAVMSYQEKNLTLLDFRREKLSSQV